MQKTFLQKLSRKTIITVLVAVVAVVAAVAFFANPVPSEAAETPALADRQSPHG